MPLSPSAHVDTFCRDRLPSADEWPDFLVAGATLDPPVRLNCAAALLDETALRVGADRPCLWGADGEMWTYGALVQTSNRVAAVLVEDYGVVPGNRVLLRGPNTPWLVACWFGVLKTGAVAVTTMPLLRAGELVKIAEISQPQVALCDGRLVDELEVAAIPGMPIVRFGGDRDLTAAVRHKPPRFDPIETAADDVALLAFTSGTTGLPKATVHFHRDVLAVADTYSAHIVQPREEDVFIGTPPLAFTFGLGGLVVFPLRAGASTVLLERSTPDQLADAIAEHQVTVCFTAPTAYRSMLAAGRLERLTTLRRAVSAGEHLPAKTWQAFHDATGIALIDGIGSTEMLHIFISAVEGDIRPGSTGRPVPGYVAAILGPDGEPLPPGIPGRLAVKGPTGCRYLSDWRQREYVRDGWNITGDTFVMDAEGYFWYHARNDDMIVASGYNIAGPEVEEALASHPDVLESAVVGLPDDGRGHIVTAFVVLRDGVAPSEGTTSSLQRFVKEQIAPYKYPRRIIYVTSLPKTATGKLQRYQLRGWSAESSPEVLP